MDKGEDKGEDNRRRQGENKAVPKPRQLAGRHEEEKVEEKVEVEEKVSGRGCLAFQEWCARDRRKLKLDLRCSSKRRNIN